MKLSDYTTAPKLNKLNKKHISMLVHSFQVLYNSNKS